MSGKSLLAKLLGTGAATAALASPPQGQQGQQGQQGNDGTVAQPVDLEKLAQDAFDLGRADGMTAGATAERERFGTVLTTDLGAKHTGLAITLLSTTDNSPDQIAAALAASDKSHAVAAPAPPVLLGAPVAQVPAADPLAATTPLVKTGNAAAASEGAEAIEPAKVSSMWDTALGKESSILTASGFAVAGFRPAHAA